MTQRDLEAQVAERTEALRQSETRNSAILSTIPDMMSLVSRAGIHLDSIKRNPQLDLAPPHVSLIGKSIAEYLPPELAAQKLAAIEQALSTGQMQIYEQAIQRPGRMQHEELRVLPYGADTVLIMIRDVTERKQIELELQQAKEKAEAANRAKTAFLANISHDLRTPLNAILGYGQLMARDAQTEEQRDQIEIVNRNGEYLLQLINDILWLSKIEAGQLMLEPANVDLHALLNSIISIFRIRAQAKGLDFSYSFASAGDSEVPKFIHADRHKLRQIITNLLDNAIKFTPQGRIELRVQSESQSESQSGSQSNLLVIEVEDTGVGIVSEDLEKIFEMFVQSTAGEQLQQGIGLGLAISHRFVQRMGGQMTLRSQLGHGSLFRVELPLQPTSLAQIEPPAVSSLPRAGQSRRMLVVDDTDTNLKLMTHWLKSAGFEVQQAQSGQVAIEQAMQFRPDLIWMDLRMPGMDGYEAMRQIKQAVRQVNPAALHQSASPESVSPESASPEAASPEAASLGEDPDGDWQPHWQPYWQPKIIALTAAAFEEARQEILAAGFDDFVAKPCSESIVLAKIAQHLDLNDCYTASRPTRDPASRPAQSLGQGLDRMPADWIAQLNHAARSANEPMIFELLEALPADCHDLKATVKQLVHEFKLSDLIRLTQPASP
jgi:signal transduction histidine kinase/DNA-binding response OmpR family regulator